MGVHQAIRKATALLPHDDVQAEKDERWRQAMLIVGDNIQSEPETIWQYICRLGRHPSEEVRIAVACVLLEHLLEYHFADYFPQVEKLALTDPLFGDMFSICWALGQTNEPGNIERFEALRERLQGGKAAE